MSDHPFSALRDTDVVLDDLPAELAATIAVRDAWIVSLPASATGMEFLVAALDPRHAPPRGLPGRLDRPASRHRRGHEADHGRVQPRTRLRRRRADRRVPPLDRGRHRPCRGDPRQLRSDRLLVTVGTDSTDPTIGHPTGIVGGHPWQRSLNLGGFTTRRPDRWQGTVRHEFMHALAFKHAHQNMRGPCQEEFRWDDDPGYTPTTDADGRFVPDAGGRRSGIYTDLAGFPNFWDRAKVDHNLRTADEATSVAGRFDTASVVLYRFEPFFYASDPSPCAPTGDGISLAQEDRRGLRLLYPSTQPELQALAEQRRELQTVVAASGSEGGLESASQPQSAFASRIGQMLARSLEALP